MVEEIMGTESNGEFDIKIERIWHSYFDEKPYSVFMTCPKKVWSRLIETIKIIYPLPAGMKYDPVTDPRDKDRLAFVLPMDQKGLTVYRSVLDQTQKDVLDTYLTRLEDRNDRLEGI